ncbi:16700_t:CDS:2, partial [Acaulospora colombiana]
STVGAIAPTRVEIWDGSRGVTSLDFATFQQNSGVPDQFWPLTITLKRAHSGSYDYLILMSCQVRFVFAGVDSLLRGGKWCESMEDWQMVNDANIMLPTGRLSLLSESPVVYQYHPLLWSITRFQCHWTRTGHAYSTHCGTKILIFDAKNITESVLLAKVSLATSLSEEHVPRERTQLVPFGISDGSCTKLELLSILLDGQHMTIPGNWCDAVESVENPLRKNAVDTEALLNSGSTANSESLVTNAALRAEVGPHSVNSVEFGWQHIPGRPVCPPGDYPTPLEASTCTTWSPTTTMNSSMPEIGALLHESIVALDTWGQHTCSFDFGGIGILVFENRYRTLMVYGPVFAGVPVFQREGNSSITRAQHGNMCIFVQGGIAGFSATATAEAFVPRVEQLLATNQPLC